VYRSAPRLGTPDRDLAFLSNYVPAGADPPLSEVRCFSSYLNEPRKFFTRSMFSKGNFGTGDRTLLS
jgi:hypothetical protein